MVTTKSIVTSLDKEVVRSIKDLSADNVEFKNIYFGCKSITDADGIRFVRERTCRFYDTDHEFEDSIRCSACGHTFNRPWEPFNYCPNCGAKEMDE